LTARVVHLIVGPEHHGVVRFGMELQAALCAGGFAGGQLRVGGPSGLARGLVAAGLGVHLQFTDRLFGTDAHQAAAVVRDLAAHVQRRGGRVTATLHDLPQPCDHANYATRAREYASLSTILDGIVVSSDHERTLLRDIGIHGPVTVIPLPIPVPVAERRTAAEARSVAVFGFVYPDKGHAEVLAAMQGLPRDVLMMAVGEPSPGHDDLIHGLNQQARDQERSFVTTGYVPDDRLTALLQAVTVPVVYHRHVSASGSLNSWLSAGRRPLVPANRYAREVARRNPGALRLFDDGPGGLSSALRAALTEPSSTWVPPGTICSPTPGEAAASYRRLFEAVHR
jgi:glycosyltransferase involved in cell wall biosynthesis